jgi:hypothetical protein
MESVPARKAAGTRTSTRSLTPELARILARLEALGELLLECYARWNAIDPRRRRSEIDGDCLSRR